MLLRNKAKKRSFRGAAQVIEVIDGDTFRVFVDLGLNIYTRSVVRVKGVNTPELPTPAGLAAKAFLESKMKESDIVRIEIARMDLHGRAESDVFLMCNPATQIYDTSLADLIISAGHGVTANDKGNL
jgi:endonuclease YncB( thermonuclease family)